MEQTEKIINETGQDGEQFVKTFLKADNIRDQSREVEKHLRVIKP